MATLATMSLSVRSPLSASGLNYLIINGLR
jgi:hypothetical protein